MRCHMAQSIVNQSRSKRRARLWKDILRHKTLYLFILPCFVWLIIFSYIPMGGIVLAFKNYKFNLGIYGSPWAGLKWFREFITSPEFWMTIKNTLRITLLKLVIGFPAPIISLWASSTRCKPR